MMLEGQCRRQWLLFLSSRLSFFLFLLHVGHIVTFTPVGNFQESSAGIPVSSPVTLDSNPKASFPPHSTGDPTGSPAYLAKSSVTPGTSTSTPADSIPVDSMIQRITRQLPSTFHWQARQVLSGASSALLWTVFASLSLRHTSVNSPSSEL